MIELKNSQNQLIKKNNLDKNINMPKIFNYIKEIFNSEPLKKKLLFTIIILIIYRFLVFIPVPFIEIESLMNNTFSSAWWIEFFAMLLWWTIEQFSIIAVWLIPFINASIIMQLLIAIVPQLEELQEQWEVWHIKIQQYTRWLALPLAFLQSIWIIFFINYIIWWNAIDTSNLGILIWTAFALTVGTVMLMWLWELITENWISNWISLLIFSSIVSWISSKIYSFSSSAWDDILQLIIFMVFIVLILVILSVLLIKTRKEIPIQYARQWKIEETAVLPIPLNPVWMIPIIFSIAFVSFPYLLSQIILKFWTQNETVVTIARWIENNLNIYTQNPSLIAIFVYFMFIVIFTFFYTLVVFNPDKIADNIQRRWWFIFWLRPWNETSIYINKILMHLCLWWWIWLWTIWIYSYVLSYIPFIQQATQSIWSIPVIVSWAWVVIIVWVVQDIINKFNAEILMDKYDKI